jgi:hypothetical protein
MAEAGAELLEGAVIGEWRDIDHDCWGKPSTTQWRLEESFEGAPVSLASSVSTSGEVTKAGISKAPQFHTLALRPRTGRKHQLRLHCEEVLGCAIVGDDKYDSQSALAVALRKGGMALHAKSIAIPHPVYSQEDAPDSAFLYTDADGVVWVKAQVNSHLLYSPSQHIVQSSPHCVTTRW